MPGADASSACAWLIMALESNARHLGQRGGGHPEWRFGLLQVARRLPPWEAMRLRARYALLAGGVGALGWRLATRTRAPTLEGQVAVVTGGSRGLGLLLARELAAQGCQLALLARDTDELERARADLRARGVEPLTIPCDVGD